MILKGIPTCTQNCIPAEYAGSAPHIGDFAYPNQNLVIARSGKGVLVLAICCSPSPELEAYITQIQQQKVWCYSLQQIANISVLFSRFNITFLFFLQFQFLIFVARVTLTQCSKLLSFQNYFDKMLCKYSLDWKKITTKTLEKWSINLSSPTVCYRNSSKHFWSPSSIPRHRASITVQHTEIIKMVFTDNHFITV